MQVTPNVFAGIFIARGQFETGFLEKLANIRERAKLLAFASVSPEIVGSDANIARAPQRTAATWKCPTFRALNVHFEEINSVDFSFILGLGRRRFSASRSQDGEPQVDAGLC
jgi:hypothetical protein